MADQALAPATEHGRAGAICQHDCVCSLGGLEAYALRQALLRALKGYPASPLRRDYRALVPADLTEPR